MNAFFLAIKNLKFRPLRTGFNILLIAFSIALILCSILINEQLKNHFENNLSKTELILAAKGSPLQSILCNLYHIDAPTGNIKISSIKPFLNKNHPLIKESLPLSLGDNASGYRIVGTTKEFIDWYQLKLKSGESFQKNMDAVIGNEVAKNLNLKLGSKFQSGHGLVNENDESHLHENEFTVVGILAESNQVADRLIFTPISSYWLLHKHQTSTDENKTQDEHEDHDHEAHDHNHSSLPLHPEIIYKDSLAGATQESISSLLLRFKGRNIQTLNFGRNINENTDVMSAYPAIEMNRLYEITGSVSDVLFYIAVLISIISAISIFISLLQSAAERKKEIAVMRLSGVKPSFVFFNTLWEGILPVCVGFILGFVFAHLWVEFLGQYAGLKSKYGITGMRFFSKEIWSFVLLMCITFIAAIYPSYKAYKLDIHASLKES